MHLCGRRKTSEEELHRAFRPNTKAVFGETIANPAIAVFDIEKFAGLAHAHGVPLIVDNTFATPVLCRPFEWGADIVVHSTTKYMDGHAVQVGGVLVDSGNFNWENGRFEELCTPDESYHGVTYTKQFGRAAYITKARVQLMRDFGMYPAAHTAFLLDLGLQTLAVRMERHCRNAEKAAQYLAARPEVEFVNYPTLPGSPYLGAGGKISAAGMRGRHFIFHEGRARGCREIYGQLGNGEQCGACGGYLHLCAAPGLLHAPPAHRRIELAAAGITPGLIRLSVGLEHIDDILADLGKGFSSLKK